jgi:hypothetical protein
MSTWLKLINDLKRRSPEEYLTESQRITYQMLYEMTRFPQWVNLYGYPGSGKTFIAWTMLRTTGATYISTPEQLRSLTSDQDILIIDNAPHIEADVRRILAGCNLVNATMVILITRTPITMPIRRVELLLPTPNEISEITRSLGRFGYLCEQTSLPASPNLWNVLQACT